MLSETTPDKWQGNKQLPVFHLLLSLVIFWYLLQRSEQLEQKHICCLSQQVKRAQTCRLHRGNQMGIKPLSPCFDVLQRTSEDLKWSHLQICRTTDHGEWHQVLSASNRPETQLVLCFVSLFRHSLQPETFWVWNMLKYWPLTQRREKIVTQNFKTTNLCESKPQESFIVCIHVRSLIRWWLNVAASQQNRENERHTQGDNLHIIAVRSKNHHACKKKRCNKKGHQNHKEAFSRFLVSQRSSEL